MLKPGTCSRTVAGSYVVKPRILGIDPDRKRFEASGMPVWYEWRYEDTCRMEPAIITGEHGVLTQGMLALPDVIDWENCGVNWRLWTHRPTEELRKVVAWGAA